MVAHERSAVRGAFFAHRADDGEAPVGWDRYGGRGGHETGQRAFRIYRTAPVQGILFPAHLDETRYGVDVAEQHDFVGPVAALADGVSGGIHEGGIAHGTHAVDQVIHGGLFLVAGAVDFQ